MALFDYEEYENEEESKKNIWTRSSKTITITFQYLLNTLKQDMETGITT